ncbi:hypothetical protein DY000_02021868 [Brassica cretica]|uniref:Retrotransposon gag domain-containing protein n=1 Tax=Brassica cretica TaxID=69181 RepID=A0ABQ7E5G0_BRACR|nr:hypothetical protein DY000_02021868 [Brassica cretica]
MPVSLKSGSSKKESPGLCTIRKSTREVSINTLQAAAIDSVHDQSIDTRQTTVIDRANQPSNDNVHPTTVHRGTAPLDTVHPTSIDTVQPMPIDTVHLDEEGRPRNNVGQLINAQGTVIPDVIVVAEMIDFEMSRKWYDGVGQDPFQGFTNQDPRNHIEELEDLVSRSEQNQVFEYHMLCKIFPYSISGDAFRWFSQIQPGSLTSWEDIERAFLYKFLDDAEATREKEKNDKWYMLIESWQIKREDLLPRHLVDYIIAEDDEQHGSGELSRVEEADISDTRSSCPQDISDSTLKSIDISSCDPTLYGDKEITIEDFLELEEFLESEDGEKLGDLDSSMEVTMEDFLELEEWLEDMDLNSKKKLDDDQHTSRGDLETSPKASVDRHQPDEIDRQAPHIINQRPPYIIDRHSADIINLHPPSIIDRHPHEIVDRHPLLEELPRYIIETVPIVERVHKSETSHLAVLEHLRPPICTEEAARIRKRVKRIHDHVRIMVPCDVFEAESPIPLDRRMQFISYIESGSIDTTTSQSIDTTTSLSIDSGSVSEQKEFDVCENIFDGDTTTRSDKSGGKKRRNWKKRKMIKDGPQLSLIHHFSDGVRKSRVRSRCFSQPFTKLRALLIAEMIDKGEESMEEAFTKE